MTSSPTMTQEQLRQQIAEMVQEPADTLGDSDNLMDFGLDSMRAMNLAVQWEEAGVPLDFADLAEAPTVGELWTLLRERQESASA